MSEILVDFDLAGESSSQCRVGETQCFDGDNSIGAKFFASIDYGHPAFASNIEKQILTGKGFTDDGLRFFQSLLDHVQIAIELS